MQEIGLGAFDNCPDLLFYVEAGSFALDWCDAGGINSIVKVLSGTEASSQWLLHGRDNQYTLTYSAYSGEGGINHTINEYSPLRPYVPYIKTLVLEEGITSIHNNVFASCEFETVHFPASLSFVGSGAFK